ncbi:hypothetical protein [Hydrocoleum sp. CS-953]|nr:hypothetical protein [Hydrocoleum sp. CS-953]
MGSTFHSYEVGMQVSINSGKDNFPYATLIAISQTLTTENHN